EHRPGIGIGIGPVGSPDKVPGQAALALKAVEGLERRGREDAAKIPNHRPYAHAFVLLSLESSRRRRCAAPIVTAISAFVSARGTPRARAAAAWARLSVRRLGRLEQPVE